MKATKLFVIVAVSIFCFHCTKPGHETLIDERLKPCSGGEYDSTVRCGQFSVFENNLTKSGRKIALNIVVIPAVHRPAKAPIFFLEGGPGIGVTVGGSFYADSLNFYRLNHDIVLMDVRGTGESNPLHCRQLQYKRDLSDHMKEMYPQQAVKECYDSLSQLADLTQYTTTNMAMDLEEVRKWLGYGKINLFGLSFGTRLAQVFMKMFPSSVESCVLQSPTTTNSKMPLYHAQFAEESLRKIFEDCRKDSLCNASFPQVISEFKELQLRGEKKPFTYVFEKENAETDTVVIPWHSFETKIRQLMYSPFGLRLIPFIIHQSYLNNWRPFLSQFPAKASYDDFFAEGLYLCVTCTEDVPFITTREIDSLTQGTFMGDYRVQQQVQACNNWIKGEVPSGYFEPLDAETPTLVFSGYFDPVTPISMAKQILKTLPNSFHIVIPKMSHVFEGLANPECFDKMVVEFFDNPTHSPDASCTDKMTQDPYKVADN